MTDFESLRRSIIDKGNDPFEKGENSIEFVEEYTVDGYSGSMRLTFQSSRTFWFVRELDNNKFTHLKKFLRRKNCADAVVWEQTEAKQWVLHIVELKRSVDVAVWEHIKNQFIVAYRLCKMVAASLDIEFDRVLFYTALVNDNVPNPRRTYDEDLLIETTDLDIPDDAPLPEREWHSGMCRLYDDGWSSNYCDRDYIHRRIMMEETDDGTYLSIGSVRS